MLLKELTMKKIVSLLIAAICSLNTFAQKANIATGVKNEGGKLIVQLKFMFPDKIFPDASINVYRKLLTSGSWEKISATPVVKAAVVKDAVAGDDSYRNYQSFMNRKPSTDPNEENNAVALAGLMVITDNTFAKYAGCYYEDKTAEPGKAYQYRITNATGEKELAVSESVTVNAAYLPVVKGVTAKQQQQSVNINWEKNSRFYAYQVYKKTPAGTRQPLSEDPILLGKLNSTASKDITDQQKFTDTSVAAGNTVTYEVTGIDVLGNESAASTPVILEIKDMVAPEAVTRLKFKIDKRDVLLTWQPLGGNDVKAYNVYRNSSADTVYRKINLSSLPAGAGSYTDKSLNEGAVYGYKIESVDQSGNGTLSRAVKAFFPDKTPPAKPTGLKAVTRPGIISLSWEKNKEADLKGYYIYRASTREKEDFNMLYKEALPGNSFTDTLPGVAKNEFVYYISAVDKHFNVSAPSDTVIALLPDTMAPHAPVIRDLVYAGGIVKLNWAQPDDDGKLFDVYRSDDSINSIAYKKVTTIATSDKSFADRVAAKGKAYHYYIVAKDNAGNVSPRSAKRSVYADMDSVAVTAAGDVKASYNSRDTAVTISWVSPAADLRGCIVYRKDAEAQRFRAVSSVMANNSFTDKDVEAGKTYLYLVRSFYNSTDKYMDSRETSIHTN